MSEPKLAFNDMFHLRKHTNDNVMVSPLASLFSFHFKDGENTSDNDDDTSDTANYDVLNLGEILAHML